MRATALRGRPLRSKAALDFTRSSSRGDATMTSGLLVVQHASKHTHNTQRTASSEGEYVAKLLISVSAVNSPSKRGMLRLDMESAGEMTAFRCICQLVDTAPFLGDNTHSVAMGQGGYQTTDVTYCQCVSTGARIRTQANENVRPRTPYEQQEQTHANEHQHTQPPSR